MVQILIRSIEGRSIENKFDRSILQGTQYVAEAAEQIRETQSNGLECITEAKQQ